LESYPQSNDFLVDLGSSYHFTVASLVSLELPCVVACIEEEWCGFEYDCGIELPLSFAERSLENGLAILPAGAQQVSPSTTNDGRQRWVPVEAHALGRSPRSLGASVLLLDDLGRVVATTPVLACDAASLFTDLVADPFVDAYLVVGHGGRLASCEQLAAVASENLGVVVHFDRRRCRFVGPHSPLLQRLLRPRRVRLPLGAHNEETLAKCLGAALDSSRLMSSLRGRLRLDSARGRRLVDVDLAVGSIASLSAPDLLAALRGRLPEDVQASVVSRRLRLSFRESTLFECEGDENFDALGLPPRIGPCLQLDGRELPAHHAPCDVRVSVSRRGHLAFESVAVPSARQGDAEYQDDRLTAVECLGHLPLGTLVTVASSPGILRLGRAVRHVAERTVLDLAAAATALPASRLARYMPLPSLASTPSAPLNLYFRSTEQWCRLAEVLGFEQGANHLRQFATSPRQMNLDPPGYVLLELDMGVSTSSTFHHRFGGDLRAGSLLTKVPTYYGTRVLERHIQASKKTTCGVAKVRHIRVRLLTPWHTLWPMHGREFSLTLQLSHAQQAVKTLMA
jgi:hypothetical protein